MSTNLLELLVFKNLNETRQASNYTLGFLEHVNVINEETGSEVTKQIIAKGAIQAIQIQPDGNTGLTLPLIQVNPLTFEMSFGIEAIGPVYQPLPPIIIKGGSGGGREPSASSSQEPISSDDNEVTITFNAEDSPVHRIHPPNPPYTKEYLIESDRDIFSTCTIYPQGMKNPPLKPISLSQDFIITCLG
jgi:hypothetical protein